jgi:hypothetical protein
MKCPISTNFHSHRTPHPRCELFRTRRCHSVHLELACSIYQLIFSPLHSTRCNLKQIPSDPFTRSESSTSRKNQSQADLPANQLSNNNQSSRDYIKKVNESSLRSPVAKRRTYDISWTLRSSRSRGLSNKAPVLDRLQRFSSLCACGYSGHVSNSTMEGCLPLSHVEGQCDCAYRMYNPSNRRIRFILLLI